MAKYFWKLILLLLIILPINFSCTATLKLKPQPQIKDSVEFFLSDQGRHSSLLFPSSTGEWIEFTYGEWEWFAKNNDHWHRVPLVLFLPTQGTLGRRTFRDLNTLKKTYHPRSGIKLISLRADKSLLDRLRKKLEIYFLKSKGQALFNPTYQLYFVPHQASFHIFHLCNHHIAEWLEELNYEVNGWVTLSDWELSSF